MNRRSIAIVLLVPFLILTTYALWRVGLIGIFEYHLRSPAGWQVFTDLVIALVLLMTWWIPELKRNGKNPRPWIIGTVLTGSIAPLVYLALTRTSRAEGTER